MYGQQKFTFDTEFHAEGDRMAPTAQARQKKTLTMEEIETLKTAARVEGEDNASARAASAIERNLAALTIALRAVLDQSHAEIEAVRGEAAAIALAAAVKLAPAAIAALPAADVENALREAMREAIAEPRLILRAAPQTTAHIAARLEAIAQEEGYEGRLTLTADPALTGADCRIEWRGGGAERSLAAIQAAVAEIITQRFSETCVRKDTP